MAWWVVALSVGGAACRAALNSVLDIPPPKPAPPATATPVAITTNPSGTLLPPVEADTIRPVIESVPRDSAVALLPRDHAGNIDWAEALRNGTIAPRSKLPGQAAPPVNGFQFAFDFTYKGLDTLFDARVPHSTHTEWIACQQCHPRIFPYRNTPVTMGEVFQGKLCGECHGKVAFPPTTGCERCHTRMTMPANRAQPVLLGDVTLGRVVDTAGNAGKVDVGGLPRAVFPHWVHRMRYRCKVCHMEVFEPRVGANVVTMRAIADGQFCGACHDGATAFRPSIDNCQQCHRGTVKTD